MLIAVAVAALAWSAGCVADTDEAPSDEELADLDGWVVTSDGKADLPTAWNDLIAWMEDTYTNRMSAVWNNQEHPRTAAAAITRVRTLMQQAGLDATRAYYPTTVRRLRVDLLDHSEINVVLAPGKVIRLVGDPKGAGVFVDAKVFKDAIGAKLCLTWSELVTAIEASYANGVYGADFVCHNITERVLRALDASSATYASQIRTYQTARWIWGPIVPSFNPKDPADWAISRSCPR